MPNDPDAGHHTRIVEAITEFLPISSTGHLSLASRLLGLSQTDFQKSFVIAIQLVAIASVIALFWERFLELAVVRVLTALISGRGREKRWRERVSQFVRGDLFPSDLKDFATGTRGPT